jgi:hypothetical protein
MPFDGPHERTGVGQARRRCAAVGWSLDDDGLMILTADGRLLDGESVFYARTRDVFVDEMASIIEHAEACEAHEHEFDRLD